MAGSRRLVLDRREFLKLAGAGGVGLALGYSLYPWLHADVEKPGDGPWIWVKIGGQSLDPSGDVTIVIPRCEMGQGTMTGLAMIVADELDIAWSQIQTEFAPTFPEYGRLNTAASASMRTLWRPLRTAGATARALLIAAAAEQWTVDAADCRTKDGRVSHPSSGRSVLYAEVASRAAALPLPREVQLKRSGDFSFIGRPMPRLDIPNKTAGSAVYGIDVELPGMLVATIVHCPVYGGTLRDWDTVAAKAIPGVRDIVGVESLDYYGRRALAVAVVADSYWSAKQGADTLELQWDTGQFAGWNSDDVIKWFHELAGERERRYVARGDAIRTLRNSAESIAATYYAPYLAHAPMEPMNCTVSLDAGRCHVWAPTQSPTDARDRVAAVLGMAEENVIIHQTYLGGGFGRRQQSDFAVEAAQIAKAVRAPVKLIWSREEDIRHDYYRPATLHWLRAGLDAESYPSAWHHRIAGVGTEVTLLQGIDDVPYAIPNKRIGANYTAPGPVQFGQWHSVAKSQNTFVTECFMDEVARAGGHDPFELRRHLLRDAPRHRAVLELAAEKAGWEEPLSDGRYRGIALGDNFASCCAQVAEVSLTETGGVRVHRIVCAAECGKLVNPDSVAAQMEGGIIFALSAALYGEITIRDGRVEQSNFHDYRVVRMSEAPAIEVHLIEMREDPGAVGETGVPPLAPAVANAVSAATGRPVRSLPILPLISDRR